MKTILDIFTYCFLCLLLMKLFIINFYNCTVTQGMHFFLMYSKDDYFKIILGNQHPVQGRLPRKTQALIWNFLIWISNTIKDQFGLFLFSKTRKYLWSRLRDLGQNRESHGKTVRLGRSGKHLFEWLCCYKWIHFSLNWRMFWVTHLLVNLLF